MKRQKNRYRQATLLGSSPEQIVPLLYTHLLKNLKRARKQIDAGDIEGKCECLQQATDIVYELIASLDFTLDSELPSRLASLYAFFARELQEIGRTLDRDRLLRLEEMVGSLHEAWSRAATDPPKEPEAGGPR